MSGRLTFRTAYCVTALLLVVLVVAGCAGSTKGSPNTPTGTSGSVAFANPNLLVETAWLAEHLNDPKVRVIDVRKADAYKSGHIRNSVNLDTMDSKGPMYDQGSSFAWAVLPREKLEALLGDLGISNDTIVVAVDDARMLWASRLFWTLEYYGHANGKARVLNGGLKKWQSENRELTPEVPRVQKASFAAKAEPGRLATKQQILGVLGDKNTTILATIPEPEFKGDNAKNHLKGGHIPGALRLEWTENLTPGDAAVFKPAGELAALYQGIGMSKDKNVIVY